MAKATYIAILEVGPDGYDLHFPDLDGCVSFGTDADDAIGNARQALSLHLERLVAQGTVLPIPSGLRAILPQIKAAWDKNRTPALYAAVEVEAPDQGERVNVYLAKSLLERVDAYCGREGVNRSAFFSQAANAQLAAVSPPSPEEVEAAMRVLVGGMLNNNGETKLQANQPPTARTLPATPKVQRDVLPAIHRPPLLEPPIEIDGRAAVAVLGRWLRNSR